MPVGCLMAGETALYVPAPAVHPQVHYICMGCTDISCCIRCTRRSPPRLKTFGAPHLMDAMSVPMCTHVCGR